MSGHAAPQFREEMRAAWDVVEDRYDSEAVLGRRASQTMLLYSARSSHHELPIAVSMMAGLFACANGATVQAFPGKPSPLALCPQNVNYPQTRKSSVYSMLSPIGVALDKKALQLAEDAVARLSDTMGTPPANGNRHGSRVEVASSNLTTCTEAAFFQRCSGDFNQTPQSEVLRGRLHFGTLANLDEAYKLYRMLGLLSGGTTSKSSDSNAVVSDAASEFNRLLQTGTASMATKTAGTFGECACPPISLGLAGNAHPSMVIPMERGEIGSNHAAAKERLLFVTGPPIEPYAPLPHRLELPDGVRRWKWPQLLKCMMEPLGLPPGVDQLAFADATLNKASECLAKDDHRSDDDEEHGEAFAPDSAGYVVTLVDGSSSRLRFRGVHMGSCMVWVPEIRVANRSIDIPRGQKEEDLARRVLDYFATPNMEVPLTGSAALTLSGLCTCFNAQCAVARDCGDVMKAARLGAASWHLAMLSCGVLLMELAVGDFEGCLALRERRLAIEQHHVVRAYDLMMVLQAVRDAWCTPSRREAKISSQEKSDLEEATRRAAAAAPSGLPLGGRGFGAWAPTQVEMDVSDKKGDAEALVSQRADGVERQAPEVRALLPSDVAVPSMSVGYGPDGAQVQRSDLGTVILSDREVMRATILRGEATVFGADVCGSISRRTSKQDEHETKRPRKESLKLCHWEAVMKAGLQMYRVGTFFPAGQADEDGADRRKKKGSYVKLELPPADDDGLRLLYNNRLVEMCQVTYATFIDAASRRMEKSRTNNRDAEDVSAPVPPRAGSSSGAREMPGQVPHAHLRPEVAAWPPASGRVLGE